MAHCKSGRSKIIECVVPHCTHSTLGTEKAPFGHVYAKYVHANTIDCVTQGQLGPQGEQGKHGCPGQRGWQGCTGIHGTHGKHGASGPQGNSGPHGPPGEKGKHGRHGTQGSRGQDGQRGFQGFTANGSQGYTGTQGTIGFQGKIGLFGPQGIQGNTGVLGTQGNFGFQGNLGNSGMQGIRGVQGEEGKVGLNGPQGQQGIAGLAGTQGDRGMQGLAMEGVQGVEGPRGDPGGPIGPQGFFGSQGVPGPSDGPMGPSGPQGQMGAIGTQGQGLFGTQGFLGVQGLIGQTGAQGQGLLGPQGNVGQKGFQGPSGNNNSGPQSSALILFGTDPNMDLNSLDDVLIDTNTGNFLQSSQNGNMVWQILLDDSLDAGSTMVSCCLSDDSQFMFVIRTLTGLGTSIYRSTNMGTNFTPVDIPRAWTYITCSLDGSIVMATVNGNAIHVSTTNGLTFIPQPSSFQLWSGLCSSQTGAVAMTCTQNSSIFTSENFGATWVPRDSVRVWKDIACSGDGLVGIACTSTNVFVSLDMGHTWNDMGFLNINLLNVGLSGDASLLFVLTDIGQCYFSTNFGNTFVLKKIGVADAGFSQDASRILFTNDNNTSSYSQDGGQHFADSTTPIANFQQPLMLTSNGNFALSLASPNSQGLLYGTTIPQNVVKFNSLVSDSAVTSKKLTGLTALLGRLTANDTLLQLAGKFLAQDVEPLSISIFSQQDVNVSKSLVKNLVTPIDGPGFFVSSGGLTGFICNFSTGLITYAEADSRTFRVSVNFSVRSLLATVNDEILCTINGLEASCKLSPSARWQSGTITQTMGLFFNAPIQLNTIQKTSNLNLNVEFTSISYCITQA